MEGQVEGRSGAMGKEERVKGQRWAKIKKRWNGG